MGQDNERTEDECCNEAHIHDADAVKYGKVMLDCFDVAIEIVENAGLGDSAELQTRIALALFGRAARVLPEQEQVFSKALKYLDILGKEKEADMARGERLREFMPITRPFLSGMGHGVILSSATCHHPGLRMLHVHLSEPGDSVSEIIEAMTISGFVKDSGEFLMCPHCRAFLPVEKVRNGELWNAEAEASRKAAREAAGEGE